MGGGRETGASDTGAAVSSIGVSAVSCAEVASGFGGSCDLLQPMNAKTVKNIVATNNATNLFI
jgi:hypothetical protein